ncbi:MAG: radical SAM family heme chaperone HemW, partial [Clostridiales bacterium]|nr:radical SAM family heme chaperone HemW [Clostridiales bacterium]
MSIKSTTGVYIHIPFCLKKCLYCDFPSFAGQDSTFEAYKNVLIKEISASAELSASSNLTIDTIFFGGGTPTILPPKWIEEILRAIYKFKIASNAEITIEANPCTINLESLGILKSIGINRLSVGMQAGQDHLLSALGRLHDKKIFLLSYEAALKAGFDNINLDLIFSLPNQTTTDWEETLEFAALLKPTHISAYSLIIEEGTDFYRQFKSGRLILPDEETDRKMYEQTENILLSHGYEQYEISNYSKPGYECKHNIKYWARDNTLGFGLSSHSFYNETRWRNTINLREYMSQPPTRLDVEHLRDHDAMAETMILGLRLNIG